MQLKRTLIIGAAAAVLAACEAPREAVEVDVIPYPQSVVAGGGTVALPSPLTFSAAMPQEDLNDLLAYLPGYALPMEPGGEDAFVQIEVGENLLDSATAEGYKLSVDKHGVHIQAATAAGAFYGLQTLAQLARGKDELPVLSVEDAPRFPYRGLHLDVSRHFFDKEHVKKQIDLIATYKMNRLHWHLTDGGGWRLEVPGYPELTEVAAWRKPANFLEWGRNGRFCPQDTEGAYGGYYTADDVCEVVEYARLRHVTVIPEIEMPGHSSEVLAVYPQLSCTGKPYTSGEVCIGNEEDAEKVLGFACRKDAADPEEAYRDMFGRLCDAYGFRYVISSFRQSRSASDNDWSGFIMDGETREFFHSRTYRLTPIADRIGGGDSFAAGCICGFLDGRDMKETLSFAVAASALKHTIPGDFDLISREEAEELMTGGGLGRVKR